MHPYDNLPADRFWRSGVSDRETDTLENFYTRKFEITRKDKVATAGSCFAQHVARHMKQRGFSIMDLEPPLPGLTTETAQKYGYETYSARYGNIYTARQLLQLVIDAFGIGSGSDRSIVRDEDIFERNGRFFDGLRPNIEPDGFDSFDDAVAMRRVHLDKVRKMFLSMDVFVFTFGLTETWENIETGTVYPVCPGVIAGEFSDQTYRFRNLTFAETMADFKRAMTIVRRRNKDVRLLITVSPVPLTATASGDHVLKATTYSKSVLRAVAGELAATEDGIDYFPSYEIITSSLSGGRFFADNLRSVTDEGVNTVMQYFFAEHDRYGGTADRRKKGAKRKRKVESADELVCEEQLLDAFAR